MKSILLFLLFIIPLLSFGIERDLDFANNYLDFILNDSQTQLPATTTLGATLNWEVYTGKAYIKDNVIFKSDGASENEKISLKVTASKNSISESVIIDNLILKDAYVANLMSYFTNRNDTRGMKISYSYDCKNFMPINKGKSIIKPSHGSRRMRDPSIFRIKEGGFGVVSTQGWDNPQIYLFDTNSLTSFSNERFLDVATRIGSTVGEQEITKERAWAPEISYDRITNQYFIYWSDPTGNVWIPTELDRPIYYNTSTDLISVSEASVFFETGYRIIDSSIRKINGNYFMVVKNDQSDTYGTIFTAKSTKLEAGSFTSTEKPIAGKALGFGVAEGPTLGFNYQNNRHYIYFDEFSGNGVTAISNNDIENEDGWVYERDVTMAPSKVKFLSFADKLVSHCGIIDITQKELDRIISKWGVTTTDIHDIKYEPVEYLTELPSTLTVSKGSTTKDLNLPSILSIRLNDGSLIEAPVNWIDKKFIFNSKVHGILNLNSDKFRNTKLSIPVKIAKQ